MPHTSAQKEAAYPKVRVYAATRDLIRQLAKEHGGSTLDIVRDAVEALLKEESRTGKGGASGRARVARGR